MQFVSSAAIGLSAATGALAENDPFIQHIHTKVMETIQHSENIPGLKAEEFKILKPGIADRWNTLVAKGVLEISAPDSDVRPYFVALQGIIEHVLASELKKSVQSLTGVIHTPMPATPLCSKGEISKELVDSSIENDPARLFTIKARTTIIRDYLYQGGDLYIAYPEGGKKLRTEEQQQIYNSELNHYPAHLFDRPLKAETIETDLIGAFYLFKNADGKVFAFAIKMTQAKDPQEMGHFGLWFGEAKDSPAAARISKVMEFIQKNTAENIPLPQ